MIPIEISDPLQCVGTLCFYSILAVLLASTYLGFNGIEIHIFQDLKQSAI